MSSTGPTAQGFVAGLVVAGGRSERFGGEKAVALLADRPLLDWATARLQRQCIDVAVSARPGSETEALARTAGLTVLHDADGDPQGPLAGIRAGLAWAAGKGATLLAVSPADTPLLPDDVFARLVAAAASGSAMAVTADGRQPLCAVWPVQALASLTAALAGGRHPPVHQVLEALGAARVEFSPPESFANINTRHDLAAAENRLGIRSGR